MKKYKLIFFIMAFMSLTVLAQEENKTFTPTLNWSGFTHLWYGYVQNDDMGGQYGFSIKYMRLKATGKLTENIKWGTQFGFDKGSPALKDIYLSYEPQDYFKLRVGQFAAPGAKSGVFSSALWSSTKMMFNDRTNIVQGWASNSGLSGYRSGGAMLYGDILENKLHYYVMAAMPKSGTNFYFNPNVKTPVYENPENGAAVFSRFEFTPTENIELGINLHSGKGNREDSISITRSSYSVYYLMRAKKYYVMAEYIAGKNSTVIPNIEDNNLSYNGYKLELAYKFSGKYEPTFRFDTYTPNTESTDSYGINKYNNVTLGFNYYPAKNIVLMANYVIRGEVPDAGFSEFDNNLFYFQLRYKFSSKK